MKHETIRTLREMAYFGSLGFQVAFAIIIGYFFGQYLDSRVFGTTPVLTYVFLGVGIAAGFRNIALAIRKVREY